MPRLSLCINIQVCDNLNRYEAGDLKCVQYLSFLVIYARDLFAFRRKIVIFLFLIRFNNGINNGARFKLWTFHGIVDWRQCEILVIFFFYWSPLFYLPGPPTSLPGLIYTRRTVLDDKKMREHNTILLSSLRLCLF